MPTTLAALAVYLEWFGRLGFAALMGLIIGYERERGGRPAGLRTHMLVALGSSLVMVTGAFLVYEGFAIDITRLGAQVVSGIGFLGAGAIIKSGTGVRGLTTAATLWIVAGIGLAAGAGFFWGSGLVTLITFICLKMLKSFENRMLSSETFTIHFPCESEKLAEITALIESEKLTLMKITAVKDEYRIIFEGRIARIADIIKAFNQLGYVKIETAGDHER